MGSPKAVEARLTEGGKRIEEVTTRGLGHRIKIEILAILHDGPASTTQLARFLRQNESKVYHHVQMLLEDGAIEEAGSIEERNHNIVFYRQVEVPFFSDQAIAEMTPEERQITAALILQASAAEALAALWAGKMYSDPRVWLAWEPITLSERGRNALADELQESWDRVQEITAEDVNHRARTGEEGLRMIVATFGYQRARTEPHEPASGLIEVPPRKR
jgi:DNA-binding transcriptional ArsR family regulator